MKKRSLLLVAIILIVSLICVFTACNVEDLLDDVKGGNENYPFTEDQIDANIKAAAANGYEISFDFTTEDNESGEYTIGAKDNIIWVLSSDGENEMGYAIKKIDSTKGYYYNYNEGKFVYESELSEELIQDVDALAEGYMFWLDYGVAFDGMLKKGEDIVVAGRSCYQYTYNPFNAEGLAARAIAAVADVELEYTFAIDKQIGITMKLKVDAKANGESSSLAYEVTSFKTGDQVVAPELKEPIAFGTLPENVKITAIVDGDEVSLTKIGDNYLYVDGNGCAYAYMSIGDGECKIYNYVEKPTTPGKIWEDWDSTMEEELILKDSLYFMDLEEINYGVKTEDTATIADKETVIYTYNLDGANRKFYFSEDLGFTLKLEDIYDGGSSSSYVVSWDTTVTEFSLDMPNTTNIEIKY